MAKLVSQVYAEALFSRACEQELCKEMDEGLKGICEVLKTYPQYQSLLTHPQMNPEEKFEVFDKVFAQTIHSELTGFCHLLLDKNRFNELDAIYAQFHDLYLKKEGIGIAYVTSAVELKVEQRDRITQKLLETTGYRTLQMHYAVDPSLIGGLIIRIGDRLIDSSLKTKLEEMKRELLKIQL